jgi:predicted nucleic acid-binding Zn ribbon protein
VSSLIEQAIHERTRQSEGLHTPRTDLTTHTPTTAPFTRDVLPRRQPVRLRDARRRPGVAVGVRATVTHFLDPRGGGTRACAEENLDMERPLFG